MIFQWVKYYSLIHSTKKIVPSQKSLLKIAYLKTGRLFEAASVTGGIIGGYYKKNNQSLNEISKSSAAHSTLIIDDNSSCKFTKKKDKLILKTGLKITQKNSVYEKNYWKINAAHDGYFKKFKSIHERNIEFFS